MKDVEKFGQAIHKAVMEGKLPPNKRGTKQLRKQVQNVLKAMEATRAFDIVRTDDVIKQTKSGITITMPDSPNRKMAKLKAQAYYEFLANHPRNKKALLDLGHGKIIGINLKP